MGSAHEASGKLASGALNVWMNGERVGTWEVQRGVHSFTYAPAWLESPRSRALSLSLPLTAALRIHGENG